MRFIRWSAFAAVALMFVFLGAVQTQSTAPTLVQVTTTVVKPAMVPDYEEYLKKLGAAAAKVSQPQRVNVFQVTHGTRNFTYLSAVRLANFAALDSLPAPAEILAKAFGEAEAQKAMRAGRSAVETSRIELGRYVPELSTNFRLPDSMPAFAQIIRTELRAEGMAAYQEYIEKLKAAQERSPNHPPVLRSTIAQGQAFVMNAVQFHNKFAERDSWPNAAELLRNAVGDAEWRRLTDASNRAIAHREVWTLRYRPDLSRGGGRATS